MDILTAYSAAAQESELFQAELAFVIILSLAALVAIVLGAGLGLSATESK